MQALAASNVPAGPRRPRRGRRLLAMAAGAQALRWFAAAAEGGSASAVCMLGDFHRDGLGGVAADPVAAYRWYARAAALDDRCAPKAQYELYVSHATGRGVPPDLPQAMQWLQKAAHGGNPQAQATLGRHYERGEGVPQDPGLAVSWRRKSREGVSMHDDHDHGPPPCPRWVSARMARMNGCAA
ncbi:tetratricopeptide repeat protein [Piscinibacter sakaiensis]|uniref:tetratricopeptide repeat protein n=1 Tax=Piscinibacter sakaiensis TaxID=1547922 RepID=UPI00372BB46D